MVTAHPRVCGENEMGDTEILWVEGSSPRVRGKLKRLELGERSDRLIPACAGKTTIITEDLPVSGAHPRVCGENVSSRKKISRIRGSSPRVRGKPDR